MLRIVRHDDVQTYVVCDVILTQNVRVEKVLCLFCVTDFISLSTAYVTLQLKYDEPV